MKKFLCSILSIVMLFSLSISASASSVEELGTTQVVNVDGFSVTIHERITDNYTTIRTYNKNEFSPFSILNLDQTKAVLSALGMRRQSIEKLPYDTLIAYANADYISMSTSYTKVNRGTNEISFLPEDVAIAQAAELDEKMDAYYLEQARKGQMPNESDIPGEFYDSYMEISHSALPLNDGKGGYLFTTDATWLTMPVFRGDDSIGSCAIDTTFTPNSATGTYDYDITYVLPNGDTQHDSDSNDITDIQHTTKDGWSGYAGVFNLPNNGVNTLYDNLHAHFSYSGHVDEPDANKWFNSIATYDHSLLTVDWSPSISIDTSKEVSASIGLSLDRATDSRCAVLEIFYEA